MQGIRVCIIMLAHANILQVSEHATWSVGYYSKFIRAALASVGAPTDLVQFVTGYAEAGQALVTGGVDKLIFVGSDVVGKKVRAGKGWWA